MQFKGFEAQTHTPNLILPISLPASPSPPFLKPRLRIMDATVLGASAPNGLPTKSPAVHIEPASSSPEHLPSTNAETEIRHTSEPDDIREHPTAVSPPVNGAHAVSSARRKDHYQPVDDAYSTRFATKCHPDAAAVRAELDAFFGEHWPWPSDNAREKFLEADLHGFVCWAYPFARSDRIVDSAKVMTLFFLLDGSLFFLTCTLLTLIIETIFPAQYEARKRLILSFIRPCRGGIVP